MLAPRVATALIVGVLVAAGATRVEGAVEYRDGRLTVRVRDASLADVMRDVARETDAEVRGRTADRLLTADLRDVPVRDALERLLGEHNFALTYEGGRLRVIELLGDAAPSPPRAAVVDGEPPADLVQAGEVLDRFARSERPLRVSRRLAQALGTDRPTFLQVSTAALTSGDAGVRSRAFRASLQAIEGDPAVRSAFAFAMERTADGGLVEFMRRNAGANAEEIVARLARRAESRSVREKATSVLEQLRGDAGGG